MNASKFYNVIAIVFLVLCSPAYSSSAKKTIALDFEFSPNSTHLQFEEARLERLRCETEPLELEVIIVVGHADPTENDYQALATQRAEAVRDQLIRYGYPQKKIYHEGQSTKSSGLEYLAHNRVVAVEAIGNHRTFDPVDCNPQWEHAFIALELHKAIAVAKTQTQERKVALYYPAFLAIKQKRLDLLDGVLTVLSIDDLIPEDRYRLMYEAIRSGDQRFVLRLIDFGIRISDFDNRAMPVIWAACLYYPKTEEQVVKMVKTLIAWGGELNSVSLNQKKDSALQCAAVRNWLALAELLLVNGSNPDVLDNPPPLIAGGRHREMVRKLLSWNANAKIKSRNGSTLFHAFHFLSPSDVDWISGLSIDISARNDGGETPLHEALRYATPDVLEAFVAHGASIESEGLVDSALGNLPGLIWLINKGAPLDSKKNLVIEVARRGDLSVPVIEALHRRGVSLREPDKNGNHPIYFAIDYLAPELVKRFVELGAFTSPKEASPAREYAERRMVRNNSICVHCSLSSYKERDSKVNSPEALAERQSRKSKIIRILRAVEER